MTEGQFHHIEVADPDGIVSRQDFARELTAVRERAGRTIREVAKQVGLAYSTAGDYFGGSHLPPVRSAHILPDILYACGVIDPEQIAAWSRALHRVRRAPGPRPRGAPSPYRGLATYQPEDAPWFFGRESLRDLMIARIQELREAGAGLLCVVGPSGSGKSSLLRAGLVPALRAGVLDQPGAAIWPVLLITPGARPCETLAQHRSTLTAHDGLVIVVDQFEEVFTACDDENERGAFIEQLCRPPEEKVLTVIGLRADFYAHALRYPSLVANLQRTQVAVGPMTREEICRAILEPARMASIDVESGLVELMLSDLTPIGNAAGAAHDAGALPLLSHALLATWERGQRRKMTVVDYVGIGGIRAAVAQTAEGVHGNLGATEQDLARQLFLRLVHVGDDVADTRRRVLWSDVLGTPGQGHVQRAHAVLETFIEHRLITADSDHVEIAHEALLVAWPRLRDWIDVDRVGLRTHQQLTEAARLWQENRDSHALYQGARLVAAKDWAADPVSQAVLNPLERLFLEASIARDASIRRAARRRTRQLYGLIAALAVLVVVAGSLSVYALGQRGNATHQRDLAVSRQVAAAANNLRDKDVALAAQLSLAAYRIAPTPEARSSVLESFSTPTVTRLTDPGHNTQMVAASTTRQLMAAVTQEGTVRLWKLGSRQSVTRSTSIQGAKAALFAVAFNPNGDELATAGADRQVHLWNVTDPTHPAAIGAPLAGFTNTVYSVSFSPDKRLLAASDGAGKILLWDVRQPAAPKQLDALAGPAVGVQAVAFSPDSRWLAAAGADATVRLWRLGDVILPAAGAVLTGPTNIVFSVAFSPDGRTLAAGSKDGSVWMWDVADPGRPTSAGAPLTGATSWTNSVSFSPDGTLVAGANSDGELRLWRVADRTLLRSMPHPAPVTAAVFLDQTRVATSTGDGSTWLWSLGAPTMSGPSKPIFSVAFGANGRSLTVASADNSTAFWDVADARAPHPLAQPVVGPTEAARSSGAAVLSADGHRLAVGAIDGTIQLWALNPGRPARMEKLLHGPAALIQSLVMSPDTKTLAAGGNDGQLWLFDMTDLAIPGRPLSGHSNYILSVAFDPTGTIIATGSADHTVRLWARTGPASATAVGDPITGPTNYVNSVTFSPDGHLLAAASADNTVRMWNIADAGHPQPLGQPLTGPHEYATSVAFGDSGRTLIAGAGDGTVWLWDVRQPASPILSAILVAATNAIYAVAADPAGTLVASAGADRTVGLWDTDAERVARYICSTAGDPLSAAEWAQYVQGLPYRPPCPPTP